MSNAAEKSVRVETDVYEFIVEFADKHDLKHSEAASALLRFCMGRKFDVVQQRFTAIEKEEG